MKNMKFPIDIIWLDSNGAVVYIRNNLQPCTITFPFLCPIYIPKKIHFMFWRQYLVLLKSIV